MVKIPLNNYEKIICRLIQLCCLGMTIPELGTYIYIRIYIFIYYRLYEYMYIVLYSSSTAQGGGGSFRIGNL
jgi:hypothetical protein